MLRSRLIRNAVFLTLSSVVTGGFGVAFWVIAALRFSPTEIGTANGVLSAVGIIANLSTLGLGYGVVLLLPAQKSRTEQALLVRSAHTLSLTAALILGAGYLSLADSVSPALAFLNDSAGSALLVVVLTIALTWSALGDAVFLGFRQARFTLFRQGISALIRLPLPLVLFNWPVLGIPISVTFSLVVGLAWAVGTVFPKLIGIGVRTLAFRFYSVRTLVRVALPNFITSSAWSAPNYVLPLIVLTRFGPEQNGAFYIAWMLASLTFTVASSLASSSLAEGSEDPSTRWQNFHKSLAASFLLQALIVGGVLLWSGQVAGIFGAFYGDTSVPLLRILVLSSFGYSLSAQTQAVLRLQARHGALALVSLLPTGSVLAVAMVVTNVQQLCWVWVISVTLSGIVGLIFLGRRNVAQYL